MLSVLVSALLILVSVIHLLPLSGALSRERVAGLYDVPVEGPDLTILLRHRAILFGLLGAFLLFAAFVPTLQVSAIIAGLVSVLSFIAIAASVGGYNAAIRRVVIADRIAVVALLVAAGLRLLG